MIKYFQRTIMKGKQSHLAQINEQIKLFQKKMYRISNRFYQNPLERFMINF